MNNRDAIEIRQQVINTYNTWMPDIYRQWRQYTPVQVKLEVLSILTTHILSAAKDNERKRKHRKLRFANLKNKVKLYESEIGKVDEYKAVERSW